MVQREQDGMNRAFLLALMREQQIEEQNEIILDVKEKPHIEGDQSLAGLAERVVEEATAVTPRGLAQDVLSSVGIDTREFVGEPEVRGGHLKHVGRRARKIALKQNDVKIRRAIKRAKKRPALGQEFEPRIRARKLVR